MRLMPGPARGRKAPGVRAHLPDGRHHRHARSPGAPAADDLSGFPHPGKTPRPPGNAGFLTARARNGSVQGERTPMKETRTVRRLLIDFEKCCGCFACAVACPEKRIAFSDQGSERHFSAPALCATECDACRTVCPVDAVGIEPVGPEALRPDPPPLTWSLPLTRCRRCGHPFTTERIRRMLREKLAVALGAADVPMEWIPLCPACRRDEEALRVRAATRTLADPLP